FFRGCSRARRAVSSSNNKLTPHRKPRRHGPARACESVQQQNYFGNIFWAPQAAVSVKFRCN
uniref:Uncharacterized protein n=1 Tax=Anopheles arabiensis TaxID=7173 RepID=A0A182IH72_ANOAR